jgi:ABC-type glycerol-3-phosphate transport system substrate-binding protein
VQLAAPGHLLPLGPVVAADRYDLKQLFPRAVAVAKIVDDKLFGLPNQIHSSHIGLFYNKSLFDTAGVKPPELSSTYDDLVGVARQVMAAEPGVWGILTETSLPPLLCFVRSFGGEMLNPPTLGKKPALDRGPASPALQWLYDLRHRHKVHPLPSDQADFNTGDVAMLTTGMWGQTRAIQIGDRFTTDATLIQPRPGAARRARQLQDARVPGRRQEGARSPLEGGAVRRRHRGRGPGAESAAVRPAPRPRLAPRG